MPHEKLDDGQAMCAAMAQLDLVALKRFGKLESHTALKIAFDDFYPKDWDPAEFVDHGSDVHNLMHAIALLYDEVARLGGVVDDEEASDVA